MSGTALFFMVLGVAYAATWPFRLIDLLERRKGADRVPL